MATVWPTGLTRPHTPWWAGRVGLLVLIVVAGYWLSLASLLRELGGQTPIAFVGLAPLLALGLLWAGLRRRLPLPTPGRVDLVVGLMLIAAAAAIVFLAPSLTSVYFWAARLDLISLPLFVGGALILLFGWRVLFVARGALALLLLAWPLPYLVLIENTSEFLTAVTASALAAITRILPIATPVGGDATFLVAYAPGPFAVQVATACAGLNSTVAFLLIGGAFTLLLTGRIVAKLAWLALGLVLIFALNVVRVVLLVAVGAGFGQSAAFDLFHPVAGMLALLGGLVVMLGLLPRFGLRIPLLQPAAPQASPWFARPAPPSKHHLVWRAVLLLVIAALFGTVNGTFAAYEQGPNQEVARPLTVRLPTATSGSSVPVLMGDRIVYNKSVVNVGKPYFGDDSTWTRYVLGRGPDAPHAERYPVWLDDIRVTDRQKLVDFGVEKCYRFHGQSIDASEPVALGYGVVGRIVVTTFGAGQTPWVVIWWEWPIQIGQQILHERLVLLSPTSSKPTGQAPTVQGKPLILFDFGTAVSPEFRPLANDMASLANEIVVAQAGSTTATR